ncbi:MAG: hypothetical protein ACRDY0_09245, partial [Acidimicrobiales bacterium]
MEMINWNRRRLAAVATTVAVATGLGWGSTAWACSALGAIDQTLSVASGPPGTVVPVLGSSFFPYATIQLYWEPSNGVKGQLVGSTTADAKGHFDTTMTVPSVAPGGYAFMATSSPNCDGATCYGPWPGPSFRVTAAPTVEPSPPPPSPSGSVQPPPSPSGSVQPPPSPSG